MPKRVSVSQVLASLTPEQQEKYLADLELWAEEEKEYAIEKARLRYLPRREKSRATIPVDTLANDEDYE